VSSSRSDRRPSSTHSCNSSSNAVQYKGGPATASSALFQTHW
jgi:hypothetical protein